MTTLHDQWTALYAAGRVRWMPGMSDGCYRVTHSPSEDGEWVDVTCDGRSFECRLSELTEPDFSDPATIGCLLHQAREAWNDKGLTVVGEFVPPFAPSWRAMGGHLHGAGFQRLAMIGHDSEPAAILAAIAAAPPKVNP
jgi:hypothetical protein